jgi:plastocyanin
MTGTDMRSFWIVAAILMHLATRADAGQRVIYVGDGGNRFSPSVQTLNVGDYVTWSWVSTAIHTVTSGTSPSAPSGIFGTPSMAGTAQAFTWRADRTGSVPYFCSIHAGMTGILEISASGVRTSSFRITEVQYDEAAGKDRIEIANLGGDPGDLGKYRIAIRSSAAVTVPYEKLPVSTSPGRVVIHPNETGTTTPAEFYMAGIGDLPLSGSVALYAPDTKPPTTLDDASQIIDFVQWGAPNQPNANAAVAAGIWPSASEFVAAVPATGGYDLAFCGTEAQRGAQFWDVAMPNFRAQALCATPVQTSTWGRIKLLYR